jgi:hypothetical protein
MEDSMKNILITLLILSCSCPIFAQDFRNVEWGWSPAQVQQYETGTLEESTLLYSTTLPELNYPVALEYVFVDQQLVGATYFPLTRQEKSAYYQEYQAISGHLQQRYGNPYQPDPNRYIQYWSVPADDPRTNIELSYQTRWILEYQWRQPQRR